MELAGAVLAAGRSTADDPARRRPRPGWRWVERLADRGGGAGAVAVRAAGSGGDLDGVHVRPWSSLRARLVEVAGGGLSA